jgi:hypothetical protein
MIGDTQAYILDSAINTIHIMIYTKKEKKYKQTKKEKKGHYMLTEYFFLMLETCI